MEHLQRLWMKWHLPFIATITTIAVLFVVDKTLALWILKCVSGTILTIALSEFASPILASIGFTKLGAILVATTFGNVVIVYLHAKIHGKRREEIIASLPRWSRSIADILIPHHPTQKLRSGITLGIWLIVFVATLFPFFGLIGLAISQVFFLPRRFVVPLLVIGTTLKNFLCNIYLFTRGPVVKFLPIVIYVIVCVVTRYMEWRSKPIET